MTKYPFATAFHFEIFSKQMKDTADVFYFALAAKVFDQFSQVPNKRVCLNKQISTVEIALGPNKLGGFTCLLHESQVYVEREKNLKKTYCICLINAQKLMYFDKKYQWK